MSEQTEQYQTLEAVLTATELPRHTEAPFVAFTKMVHPSTGLVMSPTWRGNSADEVWAQAKPFLFGKLEEGWIAVPCRDAREALAQHKRNGGNGHQEEVNLADVQPIEYTSAPEPVSDGIAKTSAIEKIVISDGQVQVYVAGLKWPLKDSRSAGTIAGYYDSDTGFDAQVLDVDGTYKPEGLLCDYAKEGKYWNIKRVRRV